MVDMGPRLRQLRKQHKLTQKQVADIMGISQSYISRLEKRIIKRLKAELEKNAGDIERTEKKLENESFVARAPKAVVDVERQKLEKFRATRISLEAELAKLG